MGIFVVVFGCGLQWLDVGSQFPNQGLNPSHNSESTKSSPLDHQGTPTGNFFERFHNWFLFSVVLGITLLREQANVPFI